MSRSRLFVLLFVAVLVLLSVSVRSEEIDAEGADEETPRSSLRVLGRHSTDSRVLSETSASVQATCASLGGTCKDVSQCSGTTKSGLCPGAANIKCCIPSTTAASTSTSTPAAAATSGVVSAPGSKCEKAGGKCVNANVGSCSSAFQSGMCPGASNIKCCPAAAAAKTNTNAASTPANTNTAAPAGVVSAPGSKCEKSGGKCVNANVGSCSSAFQSGMCPGASNIKCCPAAAAANTNAAPKVDSGLTAQGDCTYGGQLGQCLPRSQKCGGVRYSGLCFGGADTTCCMPNKQSVTANPFGGNARRPRITQTTLQRLSESEHQNKWKRFKAIHKPTYNSAQEEHNAYLIFRANRVRIIYLNDRYGQGVVIFSSRGKFTVIDPQVFARRLGNRVPSPSSKSLLEAGLGVTSESEFTQTQVQTAFDESDPHWQVFSRMAAQVDEAQGNVHQDINSFLELQAEAEDPTVVANNQSVDVNAVPVGGDTLCKVNTQQGICKGVSECYNGNGTPYRGTTGCAALESSNIFCCIGLKKYTDGPVTPDNYSSTGATVGGTLEVDYRNLNLPIRNQGQCGSCWAHAAITTIEGAMARAGLSHPQLSPQYFVDCDSNPKQLKCNGGFYMLSFERSKTMSPALESEYPYAGQPQTCPNSLVNGGSAGVLLTDAQYVTRCYATAADMTCNNPNEDAVLQGLKDHGPLAVTVDASNFQFYEGGIFPAASCQHGWQNMNHAVVLVGYGQDNGAKFWLIQNSWDSNWGEQGYIRIPAFDGSACGIANFPAYVTVAQK